MASNAWQLQPAMLAQADGIVSSMATSREHTSFRHTAASVALDAVRGAAAVLVMFDHTHNLFFVNYPTAMQVSHHPALTHGLYALSSAGTEVVVVFFVLSGYLISGSVFRSMEQGRWTWKGYLTHRFVRLWLVLLPALVLCAVWDCARLAISSPGPHTGATFVASLTAAGLTWKILLGNIFFLQKIRVTTFGSDRVLWSLAAEFWYYILFPLGLLALRRGSVRTRVLNGIGFLLIAAFLPRGVLDFFPVWLCGTALAVVKPPKAAAWVRWLAILVYVPTVFQLAMTTWPWHVFKMDYLLGMLTTVFLWVMLSANRRVEDTSWTVRSMRTLAGFSYSLYLTHYPFLYFCAVWLNHGTSRMPTAGSLAIGAGLCTLAMVYAYGVASFTEFRNDQVRQWVEARLHWPLMTRRVPGAR